MSIDYIVSGHEDLTEYHDPEGVNKPKPYIYLQAAKKLGVTPSECIAIEDSGPGIQSAADAGCYTVAIPTEYTAQHDFSHAHLLLNTLSGIDIETFFKKIPEKPKI